MAHSTPISTSLCLFAGPIGAMAKRLAPIFRLFLQLISKSDGASASRADSRKKRLAAKATCSKRTAETTAYSGSKSLWRFLLLRRDIYMCAHTHTYGANKFKKSDLRLAHVVGLSS